MALTKVNLEEKFSQFSEYWRPKITAELNESYVKIAKLKGQFVWHSHPVEDELFLVIKGRLQILFRDGKLTLEPNELVAIPQGVEHCPVAEEEVQVILIEPKTTVNTGNLSNNLTHENEWI
jgi:mannose-6-phosphate isomerase-like protein (cupin superfamily)